MSGKPRMWVCPVNLGLTLTCIWVIPRLTRVYICVYIYTYTCMYVCVYIYYDMKGACACSSVCIPSLFLHIYLDT